MSEYSDHDRHIEQLKRCEIIKENEAEASCAKSRKILVAEGNVQRMDSRYTDAADYSAVVEQGSEELEPEDDNAALRDPVGENPAGEQEAAAAEGDDTFQHLFNVLDALEEIAAEALAQRAEILQLLLDNLD